MPGAIWTREPFGICARATFRMFRAASRIARILLQATQPQSDLGEITEKGYINQSRTQEIRADQISLLYAAEIAPGKFLI